MFTCSRHPHLGVDGRLYLPKLGSSPIGGVEGIVPSRDPVIRCRGYSFVEVSNCLSFQSPFLTSARRPVIEELHFQRVIKVAKARTDRFVIKTSLIEPGTGVRVPNSGVGPFFVFTDCTTCTCRSSRRASPRWGSPSQS